MMIVGLLWLEGYDQYVNALQISGQVAQGRGARSGQQVDSALNDSLLFGFLAILLAPMALALAETGPGQHLAPPDIVCARSSGAAQLGQCER